MECGTVVDGGWTLKRVRRGMLNVLSLCNIIYGHSIYRDGPRLQLQY